MRAVIRLLVGVGLAAVVLAGCRDEFESKSLHVSYDPPRGMKLIEEVAGPPGVARFASGLELRTIDGVPLTIDESRVEAALEPACRAAGISIPGSLMTASMVTLPSGRAARFELKGSGMRTLMYVLPAHNRFVMLRLTAPDFQYAHNQLIFERSLKSLRVEQPPETVAGTLE